MQKSDEYSRDYKYINKDIVIKSDIISVEDIKIENRKLRRQYNYNR